MKLTNRELAVMRILWEANEPLTVVEIVEKETYGTVDSVQRVIKNLLKKNLIAIEGYEQIGKKISRKLKPLVNSESIEIPVLEDFINSLVSKNINTSHIVASLLPTENTQKTWDELDRLEELIKKKKEEIALENPADDLPDDK